MLDLYNQNMGGFDLSDQVMYLYAFERKLKLWPKNNPAIGCKRLEDSMNKV